MRRLFKTMPADLAPQREASDEPSPYFRRERISFLSAYGPERVPAWLYLPRNATPPYQAVVYFPSGESLEIDSSDEVHRDWRVEFVIRSGRAVLHPIYQGTYERRRARSTVPGGVTIQRAQDVRRSVDYLETRAEIDRARIAYYGVSFGAELAPVFLALEKRFKAAVLLWGGLGARRPDLVEPLHYAPRVTLPVLMVNGRHDFIFPVHSAQIPLLEHLGTPAADKRHVLFDYGHIPPKHDDTIREVLDWLDKYLGGVTRVRQ